MRLINVLTIQLLQLCALHTILSERVDSSCSSWGKRKSKFWKTFSNFFRICWLSTSNVFQSSYIQRELQEQLSNHLLTIHSSRVFYQRWSRGHKARGQGHKKFRDQGQGQTLSRPRPRTKDTNASVLQKKGLQKFFSSDLKKKVFKNFFSEEKGL